MDKISWRETIARIEHVRTLLQNNPKGLYFWQISQLTDIGKSSLSALLRNYFHDSTAITKVGKNKLIKLLTRSRSLKEKRLINRERALIKAQNLRKKGFSHTEILSALRKEFGVTVDTTRYSKTKMNAEGVKRYARMMQEIKVRGGVAGGRKAVESGHLARIQPLAVEAAKRKNMIQIPATSKATTLPKVRILAHLLFDGFVSECKNYCCLGYCNTSKALLEQFKRDMQAVYKLDPSDCRQRKGGFVLRYFCRAAFDDVKRYAQFKTKDCIPKDVIDGPNEWKAAFLRAFWDDEGMVCFKTLVDRRGYTHTHRYLEAFQKSINLLNQIRELHESFGIISRLNGNKMNISRKENLIKFARLIGFSPGAKVCKPISSWYGTEKRVVLQKAIESYDQ